jgi:hypothetical protein
MEGPMEDPKINTTLPTSLGGKPGPKAIQRWSAARKRGCFQQRCENIL